MLFGFDAAYPPKNMPPRTRIVFGYIGGKTPHVWTIGEWKRYGKRRKVPIYVPAGDINGKYTAMADALEILTALYNLRVPKGNPVAIDLEGKIAYDYLTTVSKVLHWYGYRVWVYGSKSTVFGNPMCDGYWVADWRGNKPFIARGNGVVATQWKSDKDYDLDAVRFWPGWFTLRPW